MLYRILYLFLPFSAVALPTWGSDFIVNTDQTRESYQQCTWNRFIIDYNWGKFDHIKKQFWRIKYIFSLLRKVWGASSLACDVMIAVIMIYYVRTSISFTFNDISADRQLIAEKARHGVPGDAQHN